jgi:hypothetical protein
MDRLTYAAWSRLFGEDNARTLSAANNLANSYRLVGDFRAARRGDEDVRERRSVVLGPEHPYTLFSTSLLGRDLRDAGEYEQSVTLLRGVLEIYQRKWPESGETLNAQANLAVSLRSVGRPGEAAPLLESAFRRLVERFGPTNPDTLACQLSRSANLLFTGEVEHATREMRAVTDAYEQSLGPTHPHTLVCVSNVSAAARFAGDHARARELASRAAVELQRTLGDTHPYTLAAMMNLGSCVMEDGDIEQGTSILRDVAAWMAQTLGPDHPDTLSCEANLALTLREAGEPGVEADLNRVLERLAEVLGGGHPTLARLRSGRLVHRVLDPHPF